jgi:hypothetical protein
MAIAPPLLTARHFGSRFRDDHGGTLGKHFAVVAEAHRDRLAASIAATSIVSDLQAAVDPVTEVARDAEAVLVCTVTRQPRTRDVQLGKWGVDERRASQLSQ